MKVFTRYDSQQYRTGCICIYLYVAWLYCAFHQRVSVGFFGRHETRFENFQTGGKALLTNITQEEGGILLLGVKMSGWYRVLSLSPIQPTY
jgi:hypothetical protein